MRTPHCGILSVFGKPLQLDQTPLPHSAQFYSIQDHWYACSGILESTVYFVVAFHYSRCLIDAGVCILYICSSIPLFYHFVF